MRGEGGGRLKQKREGENKEEERCWDERVLRNSGAEGSLDGANVGNQRVVEE